MAETTADEVRAEVRAWLDESWDPDRHVQEWRGMLADSGWACPTWPVEWYGRNLSGSLTAVAEDEIRAFGAVGTATGVGMSLAAPTILAHGSDVVKQRYLKKIITGEHKWCQLFSEPGNGSDLAGLTTRADRDGDEWIVNGQKVWNSGAHAAAYGILMARTDWDQPKHKGISYFAIAMDQPGIEVRPLRQMNFHASFNEVFLTDARVRDDDMIGAQGEGWRVGLTTLSYERGAGPMRRPPRRTETTSRTVREAQAEAAAYAETYKWYPQRAGRADLVRPQAEAKGRTGDPLVRQKMMQLEALRKTTAWSQQRVRAARAAGRQPGPEGSLAKLSGSLIARACADVHSDVIGAEGMLNGPDTAADGMIAEVLVSVPAVSIAGGTDEIQHNIIGERVLGLPKEPSVDTDQPYRDVRTN